MEPQRTIQQSVTRIPPASRRIRSIKSVRHRTSKPPVDLKRDAVIPAIVLAASVSTKIVVLSADQAQRERERAVHAEVRRPQQPSSGLSGKLAFEALFKDETDPSKASGR